MRNARERQLDSANNPYAASKLAGESFVHAYRNSYDVPAVVLRLSNVYGRYDASDRVVPTFIARASRDLPLEVYGANKELDFLHVDDCVAALDRTLARFDEIEGSTFNVGAGDGTSLVDLAELTAQTFDSKSDVVVESNRTGEVERFVSDIDRASRELGFTPERSLEQGLADAVEWYRDHDGLFDEILA